MQTFWEGGECANLGYGTRAKKIGFMSFKVKLTFYVLHVNVSLYSQVS